MQRPRVIELIDINLVAELKKICAQRAARFPNDSLVKLFGDDDHPRTTLTANRIHLLIGEALARATGSDVIRPHDTRDEVITRKTAALLNPFKGERPLQTLVARQGMFRITVVAGQSAPDVPMENYTHDFDVHRRKWVSKINGELDCPPSVEFLSKVTGMSSATYRQRICRKGASAFDMFDRFDPDSLPTTGVQLVQLSSLVVDGQDHIPWTPDFVGDDALSASAIYVGLRLLGESEDSSRLAAKVTLASAHNLEKGITQLNRRRASLLKARGDINRDGFLDSVMEGGLAIAMKAVSPGTVAINRLITAISKVGNPWDFANPEDILELKPWVGIWQANGIELAANLKPSSNSSMDNFILDRLSDLGIQRAKGLPARHFTRGIRATLKFTPETSSGVSTKPRTSPQISFLVSVCALAILLITHGEQT